MSDERYSDKRLEDDFTVYLMFEEPLEFASREVLDAVTEDFPHMAGWRESVTDPFQVKTTAEPVLGILEHAGIGDASTGRDRRMLMTGRPGPLDLDFETMFRRAITFPEAREAVARHRSHLCVSIKATGADLAARFVAARDLNCLTAVFAKLPICTAVYFPAGDVIARPEAWVRAAERASVDEWPLDTWISYELTPIRTGAPKPCFSCATIGMAAFNGHEAHFMPAPVEPADAWSWAHGATWLLLAGGNVFTDGDTAGVDGGEDKMRLRHVAEGREAAPGFCPQTDTWLLFHPDCPFDDVEMLGPRANSPPPPGTDNLMHPEPGFLSRILGRGRGGAHPH